MAENFPDHFSGHAQLYRAARPTYPPELFSWLAAQAPTHDLAWDVACGNGQATCALAQHFTHVIGTDPSAEQIDNATRVENIEYRVETAERSTLASGAVSLITVAQALHWFDVERFYDEVRRTACANAVIAAWGYSDCHTGDEATDAVIDHLYVDLTGPYWPKQRPHIDAGYATLPFPFARLDVPSMAMTTAWRVEQALAYFRSWSATQRYQAARGEDPVSLIEDDLKRAWGTQQRFMKWGFFVHAGRVNAQAPR